MNLSLRNGSPESDDKTLGEGIVAAEIWNDNAVQITQQLFVPPHSVVSANIDIFPGLPNRLPPNAAEVTYMRWEDGKHNLKSRTDLAGQRQSARTPRVNGPILSGNGTVVLFCDPLGRTEGPEWEWPKPGFPGLIEDLSGIPATSCTEGEVSNLPRLRAATRPSDIS